MKQTRSLLLAVPAACLLAVHIATAAPVESVDSSRSKVAIQKIESFLQQEAVATQLSTMGLTQAQVSARLTKLSDTQLSELASQIDMIQAGGTM
jgi:alcohol dehydrogenase YqhD (iron-dependent ADH family)